jgi:cardiolipin synthase
MTTPTRPRSDWLTIPNLLSLGRLLATPVFCWLILTDRTLAATVLLAVMGITDNLDGRIARATGTVTEVGIVLDPASDRVVVIAALIVLMVKERLPVWLGAPVLARDVLISLAFIALARSGFPRPAVKTVGKAATFALLTALPALVYSGALRPVGLTLFVLGAVLYAVATAAYTADIVRWMRAPRS